MSEAAKARLSAGMTGSGNPNFGRRASEETRAKMSAARKGRSLPSSRRSAHTRHHTNKGVKKLRAGPGIDEVDTCAVEVLVPHCIPIRYRSRVSKQIAVRLPDDIVDFIDQAVRDQSVPSRAAFVQKALDRERRRLTAARDAALLSHEGGDPDGFDLLAAYVSGLDSGLE